VISDLKAAASKVATPQRGENENGEEEKAKKVKSDA